MNSDEHIDDAACDVRRGARPRVIPVGITSIPSSPLTPPLSPAGRGSFVPSLATLGAKPLTKRVRGMTVRIFARRCLCHPTTRK